MLLYVRSSAYPYLALRSHFVVLGGLALAVWLARFAVLDAYDPWRAGVVAEPGTATPLRDRLATFPKNAKVKVVASVHRMAWDNVPNEAWIALAPPYRGGMVGSPA